MLVDWSSTCGFVEVKSRTLLTWSFVFARMANGALYFFEDESEKKPLFVVQISDSFSAETIQGSDSRPYQFEIKNNNLEAVRTDIGDEDTTATATNNNEEEETTGGRERRDSIGASFNAAVSAGSKIMNRMLSSGNVLTISVPDASGLEKWMITCIQAIKGTVRESEAFDGRMSVVDAAGSTLSGKHSGSDKSKGKGPAVAASLGNVGSDHVISGTLAKQTPIQVTQQAINVLTATMRSLSTQPQDGDTASAASTTQNTAAAPPAVWEEMWCELKTDPSGSASFTCYHWAEASNRFKHLAGGAPNAAADEEALKQAQNSHTSAPYTAPGGDGKYFPAVPWVSPEGISEPDKKSSPAWAKYHSLWSTVGGYNGSSVPPRPVPRPAAEAVKATLSITASTTVMLLPSTLGEKYAFAVVNPLEDGIRVAAASQEAQMAWIAQIEEAMIAAKTLKPNSGVSATARRGSNSGAMGGDAAAASVAAPEPSAKPNKHLSGATTTSRSFTGNFSGNLGGDSASSVAPPRKLQPRLSMRVGLAKSGKRSSITFGNKELDLSKVTSAEGNDDKSGGNNEEDGGQRDYSKAKGVLRRASALGASSMTQGHLPKFKHEEGNPVKKAEVPDELEVPSALKGKGYLSPEDRQKAIEEEKKEKEKVAQREMERVRALQAEQQKAAADDDDADPFEAAYTPESAPRLPTAPKQQQPASGTKKKSSVPNFGQSFDNDNSDADDDSSGNDSDEDIPAKATPPAAPAQPGFFRRASATLMSPFIGGGAGASPSPTNDAPATGGSNQVNSKSLFGTGPTGGGVTIGKAGDNLEEDHLFYTTYFTREAHKVEGRPPAPEGSELLVIVWQNQRFVPIVGFSHQGLFLMRDPPALSDETGHVRFPSSTLEYAKAPPGYEWADTEDGEAWCVSDDKVDTLGLERDLTAEEQKAKELAESLAAGLESASKVNWNEAHEEADLSSDESSGDEAHMAKKKKNAGKTKIVIKEMSWSDEVKDWHDGWVYAHAFHRFSVHRKTHKYHYQPGVKDTVRRRRLERRCVRVADSN